MPRHGIRTKKASAACIFGQMLCYQLRGDFEAEPVLLLFIITHLHVCICLVHYLYLHSSIVAATYPSFHFLFLHNLPRLSHVFAILEGVQIESLTPAVMTRGNIPQQSTFQWIETHSKSSLSYHRHELSSDFGDF